MCPDSAERLCMHFRHRLQMYNLLNLQKKHKTSLVTATHQKQPHATLAGQPHQSIMSSDHFKTNTLFIGTLNGRAKIYVSLVLFLNVQ